MAPAGLLETKRSTGLSYSSFAYYRNHRGYCVSGGESGNALLESGQFLLSPSKKSGVGYFVNIVVWIGSYGVAAQSKSPS